MTINPELRKSTRVTALDFKYVTFYLLVYVLTQSNLIQILYKCKYCMVSNKSCLNGKNIKPIKSQPNIAIEI